MSLADILEEAASALAEDADAIRPANGDPFQLLQGLDADAARRVLSWVLSRDADAGVELALDWADAEGGAEVLAGLDEKSLPKAGRKALRRALHRLRSQGVELAQPEPARPVVARLPSVEEEISAGFVSSLDPRGARLVYLVEPNPSGGARLFEILLDESRGIVDFEIYAAARGRIRKFVRDAVERTRYPAVPAEPAAIRALVARIAAAHPADRALPRQFGEWRSKVAVPGATPGDQVAETLSIEGDGEGLARAAELVEKGALGPWGPAPHELANAVQESLEAHASQPEDPEKDEALWRELAEPITGGPRAEAYRQRLRESAYVLWKLDREDEARACLCAAEAFASQPAADNPVAIAMVKTLLAGALSSLRARSAETAGPAGEE
jgi:hypothetical protein